MVEEVQIRKSETDICLYRYIVLENGLKALLVHEPDCDKASAALDVHVGSYFDPEEVPGLAHFLEHLLFMGTEKYPSENEYGRYLNEHGGSSNAFTAEEHTNYFFDVNSEYLTGALDRFAQFFISPLFLEDGTVREMQAVDSEHAKNKLRDNWRLAQLERTTANPEHPYHKFSTGDIETLSLPNIRQILIDFHSKWYSANIMALVVIGKESLDELEALVKQLFSAIPNKNVRLPDWPGLPWTEKQKGTLIRARTVKDSRSLYLSWLTKDMKPLYLVKPQKYYSHLIGHEGEGSILAQLKALNWATSLSAGCQDDSSGYSQFEVSIELSSQGLQNYHEVIKMVFDYIDMMVKVGPVKEIFDESSQLSEIGFRFKEREDPSNFAYKTARNLHRYPAEYVLSGPYIQEEYDSNQIKDFGEHLTRDSVRIILATKDDPTYEGEWLKETWYKTEYYIKRIENIEPGTWTEKLHSPSPNEFIPTEFTSEKPSKCPIKEPKLVKNEAGLRVWHKIDDVFDTPKVNIRVLLRTGLLTESVKTAVALHLFTELLKDILTPIVYPAELAGLNYELNLQNEGVEIKLGGFAQKIHLLLERILGEAENLSTITQLSDLQEKFEMHREQYEKLLMNLEFEQPYWHCGYIINGILQQKTWYYWMRLEAVKSLTLAEVINAGSRLINEPCFIDSLIHGSLKDDSKITNILKSNLNCTHSDFQVFTALSTEGPSTFGLPIPLADPNSAIEVYYRTGKRDSTEERAMTGLLLQTISEPFFDQLRTKEQLGYITYAAGRNKYDQVGIRLVIQSTKGDPSFLEGRIEEFITKTPQMIEELSEESFQDIMLAQIAKLRQKKTRLSQETALYWDQILLNSTSWNWAEEDAVYLSSVSKTHLIQFVNDKLVNANKLTVQAWPRPDAVHPSATYSADGGPPRLTA